jgi:hypothetical protein
MTFAVQPPEAVAHLSHALRRHAAVQKERFQVHRRPLPIGPSGTFHGRRGCRAVRGEPFAGQWQAQCTTHRLGHSIVVEEHQRIPGVEEDRAEPLSRAQPRARSLS